jgi:Mor family transcriptional regulator
MRDENDIVKDILGRVQEFVGPLFLTHEHMRDLELDIKSDWGGDKPRINTARGLRLERRDSNLIKEWDSGAQIKLLVRKFRINERTVWRILEKYGRT